MKITILTDNNTIIDRYFMGEPGFSAYIEDGDVKVLFDLGYSDIFLRNAQKMKINLSTLDFVALSHGHCDHTWGLEALLRYYSEQEFEQVKYKRSKLIAHPKTFKSITAEGFSEIGSMLSENKLAKFFEMHLDNRPQRMTERLTYLGEIPRKNNFECREFF